MNIDIKSITAVCGERDLEIILLRSRIVELEQQLADTTKKKDETPHG